MTEAYLQLRDRIDRHAEQIRAHHTEQMVCRAGCCECCRGGLTLIAVEAVALGVGLGLEPAAVLALLGRPPLADRGSCSLLDADGRCRGYGNRPIVCRTEGMPLSYPAPTGIITCELNFRRVEPDPGHAFDMTNLETALFAVNLDYCRRAGVDPLDRVAIDRIAAAADLEPAR
jgi:hypothetical protein